MENNNLSSCKSQAYYKSIIGIDVKPSKEFDASGYIKYRKGDVITKKRFFKPARKITVKEDMYRYDGGIVNAKEFACLMFLYYDESTGKFYNKALAKVWFSNKIWFSSKDSYEWHEFNTNDELSNFVSNLKQKCKESGNELL